MPTILFVCTANQCRSPAAAALFTAQAARRGDSERWEVRSAGTWAVDGSPVVQPVIEMMAARGLDLAIHRSRTLRATDLEESDVILVMTRNHREAILAEFPGQGHKVRLLSEIAGRKYDIPDPVGGDSASYEACLGEIERLIAADFEQIVAFAKRAHDFLP
ncbi:MAG: low molecular weight protein arginine phosphatase [Anaerolineales bacterium]